MNNKFLMLAGVTSLVAVLPAAVSCAQEIGAQYKDKQAAGTVEYTYFPAGNIGITPRIEAGKCPDASLGADFTAGRFMAYLGGGGIQGKDANYPMVLGGLAFEITEQLSAYANGVGVSGARTDTSEEPLSKANGGLEVKTTLMNRSYTLRAGVVEVMGTNSNKKLRADIELGFNLDTDRRWQFAAGVEANTITAALTYTFGSPRKPLPGRFTSAAVETRNKKAVTTPVPPLP